jgi:hypothetical protein
MADTGNSGFWLVDFHKNVTELTNGIFLVSMLYFPSPNVLRFFHNDLLFHHAQVKIELSSFIALDSSHILPFYSFANTIQFLFIRSTLSISAAKIKQHFIKNNKSSRVLFFFCIYRDALHMTWQTEILSHSLR